MCTRTHKRIRLSCRKISISSRRIRWRSIQLSWTWLIWYKNYFKSNCKLRNATTKSRPFLRKLPTPQLRPTFYGSSFKNIALNSIVNLFCMLFHSHYVLVEIMNEIISEMVLDKRMRTSVLKICLGINFLWFRLVKWLKK